MQEQDQIREQLTELMNEHRDLDAIIAQMTDEAQFDQIKIQRLKKRKLALKDQITQLENRLIPDIIA